MTAVALESRTPLHPLLVNVAGVGELLGVSRSHAAKLVYGKQIPSLKIGRSRRVAVSDVAAFVERRRLEAAWEAGEPIAAAPGIGEDGRRTRSRSGRRGVAA